MRGYAFDSISDPEPPPVTTPEAAARWLTDSGAEAAPPPPAEDEGAASAFAEPASSPARDPEAIRAARERWVPGDPAPEDPSHRPARGSDSGRWLVSSGDAADADEAAGADPHAHSPLDWLAAGELASERGAVATIVGDRRRSAVEAYCDELCPGESASAVADEVLADNPPEAGVLALRRAVRTASAGALVKEMLHSDAPAECLPVPSLLALRTNGELDDARGDELAGHLANCPRCRTIEQRFEAAERAFDAVLGSSEEVAGTASLAALAAYDSTPRPAPAARSRRRRRWVVLTMLSAVTVAAILAVALVLAHHSTSAPSAPASTASHGAGASGPAASAASHRQRTAVDHRTQKKVHHRPAARRKHAAAHRTHAHHAATAATAPATPAAPVTTATPVVTATPTPTPTASPAPTPTPTPAPSSGSSSSSPSLVQSGSGNLSAVNAPTSGISSGK